MRLLPVGDAAFLVELDEPQQVQAAYELILSMGERDSDLDRPRDVVPAARTVLLDGVRDPVGWRAALETALAEPGALDAIGSRQGREVAVPVRYDGPDLAAVADAWGCDTGEVVRRHTTTAFTVAFCGFAPGFAYCTSDPALPEVPRRRDPRTRVPGGSVAMAGPYCGVYPRAMPGGWQLVGTTSVQLFDPGRQQPALLTPGDTVRFEAEP